MLEEGVQVFVRSGCVFEGCGLVTWIASFSVLSSALIGFIKLGFPSLIVRLEPSATNRAARLLTLQKIRMFAKKTGSIINDF